MQNALQYRYRLSGGRSAVLPLAICASGLAALPFLAGLPLPSVSRAPAPAAPPTAASGVQRYSQEVYVANVGRGCRWQPSSDPLVQIADCGDDGENVRVVFREGQVTEYRVIARQDPTRASAAGQAAAPPTVSAQQPSQPGRLVPNSGTPLRVTVTSGS